jgi:putative PIN family toxin of toxin-antitoxin system
VIAPVSRATPLRVILDTNVLLSGIFFGGVPGGLLTAWQEDRLALVLSPAIVAEYHEAGAELAARYPALAAPLDSILSLLAQTATVVDAPALAERVSADPDDDKFLACAIAARTPLIVSGDKHLLHVSGWSGITVVTPRQCVDRYLAADEDAAPE